MSYYIFTKPFYQNIQLQCCGSSGIGREPPSCTPYSRSQRPQWQQGRNGATQASTRRTSRTRAAVRPGAQGLQLTAGYPARSRAIPYGVVSCGANKSGCMNDPNKGGIVSIWMWVSHTHPRNTWIGLTKIMKGYHTLAFIPLTSAGLHQI